MTVSAKSFREWMDHLHLSGVQAAAVLGRSEEAISRFRHKGVQGRDANVVALAMAAYAHRLPPWGVSMPPRRRERADPASEDE